MRRKIIWALVALLAACATFVPIVVSARMPVRPVMSIVDSADSIFVRLSWSTVQDARGDTVANYVATIRDDGVIIGSTTTRDTLYVLAIEKVAGTTHSLVGDVYAVDVRGNNGATARTAPFEVVVPDPGPAAPEIRLDTIPLGYSQQIDSLRMFFPAGEFNAEGVLVMTVGEELQGCIVAWRDGQPFRPTTQAPACMTADVQSIPAMLYRRVDGRVMVRQAD